MLLLSACSDSEQDSQHSESQKYYFLESLNLVEQAGRVLQVSDLDEGKVKQALENMDRGLKLAFQVETLFLNSLDARLGKNYQRYFVKGVENYRLGIEARDRDQQQQGLELLGQWAKFWTTEQSAIKIKLNPG
jgi:hypothetical protein